ncbi:MAG: BON domain-containing protein [Planctomycetia bacterium]|nr:BON domain-containing protein [Planctomycetia bacterium]
MKSDFRLRDCEIEVTTAGGKVTLSGIVPGYIEKDLAERLCERVDGVEAVRSELRVQLLPHTDDEIARSIRQRFRNDIILRDQELEVDVHRQIVTIKGEVEGDSQRRRAEQIAREIPGVTLVHNDMHLVASSRLDEDIRADVVASLDGEGSLSGFPISIDVDRGIVTLEGVVRYRWQRALAGSRSQSVSGVHEVDNRLEVTIDDYHDEGSPAKRVGTRSTRE